MTGYIDPSQLLAALIGLNYQEALYKCVRHEYAARVASQDGTAFILTRDYKRQRVNLHLAAGLVSKAEIG